MESKEKLDAAAGLLQRLGPWHCCVRKWAALTPSEPAIVWLDGQADVVAQKTYQELDFEATNLAEMLKSTYGCKCYPPGLDFVVAFIACQILGAVAVPVYSPASMHRKKGIDRLVSLIKKARALPLLLTSSVCKKSALGHSTMETAAGSRLTWVFSDELLLEGRNSCGKVPYRLDESTHANPLDVAYIQFSSGTTGHPKGCMITQAGFLHNIHHNWHMSGIYCCTRKKPIYDIPVEEYADLTEDFQQSAEQRWGHRIRFLSWLPVTHDMGLVGMIGVPLYFGCTAYFMSPSDFVKSPAGWLEAFSKHQCSVTAAPDFAYALASKKVTDALLQRLSFRKAFAFINGAETVRRSTLELFARRFTTCGFEPWMMCPAYGLAENTLGVTGRGHDGPWPRTPRILKVDRKDLFPGGVVHAFRSTEPTNDMMDVKSVVGCGTSHGDVTVKIVQPETFEELPEWHVGEVWVASPSCALAYFDDPAATAATFGNHLNKSLHEKLTALKYLRTGDLGFFGDGELYIAGRLKSVLIIRGQNYNLQDFEEVVEQCSQIRKGCTMAFGVTDDEDCGECLGVAAEVERIVIQPADLTVIAEQVRGLINNVFQVPVHALWLTEAGTLPKTTSGKPRRHEARAMLEDRFCPGVLYCSLLCERDTEPRSLLARHGQWNKEQKLPYAPAGENCGVEAYSAPVSYGQGLLGAARRQATPHLQLPRCQKEQGHLETKEFDLVEETVSDCFKEVLGDCSCGVENNTSLGTLGLDSLCAVELATALKRRLEVEVEPFAFFDCPNMGSVVATVKNVLYKRRTVGDFPKRQVAIAQQQSQFEVYITGMACKLPGGCDGPATFWARLMQRSHFISPPPLERQPHLCNPPATATAWKLKDQLRDWQGGFINDIELFDNSYFGISDAEATAMDPQQRLLLMQAVEALNSRGDSARTSVQTGVFVGCCSEDWQRLNYAEKSQAFSTTAQSSCMLANRISYNLNFTGPSVTLDTACSSSLVALHCAWQEMSCGRNRCCSSLETAIVAAVNLMLIFDTTMALQRAGFLSPSYRCHTFDAAADGFVRSEGVAAVVVEKLWQTGPESANTVQPQDDVAHKEETPAGTPSVASESTQRVDGTVSPPLQHCRQASLPPALQMASSGEKRKAWCRVLATVVVHGGKTASVTAPCRASQEKLCRQTLSLANAIPDEICYIETHGTGTALGDPLEVAAIMDVFKSTTPSRTGPLILGAVKTNLGHLEGAAGMAGLLKSALSLAHREVPANLHLKTINPYINFQQFPAMLPCKTVPLDFNSASLAGVCNMYNAIDCARGDRFRITKNSSTTDSSRKVKNLRCIVTSLGFGGTYAQVMLQSLSPGDKLVEASRLSQDFPRISWDLKRFDHSHLTSDMGLPTTDVFPVHLWHVAWKSLVVPDLEQKNCSRVSSDNSGKGRSWLIFSFKESNAAYWKTIKWREVKAVVYTLVADVSQGALQRVLQSETWQAVLFVDGVHASSASDAVKYLLLSSSVVPLCGRVLQDNRPSCKMFMLTRGSQLIQEHSGPNNSDIQWASPHAAGVLGFIRACRAELRYSTGKPSPLYFIDLDPAAPLDFSANLLPSLSYRLTEDELDIAVRQGKAYAPRLWPAGPLFSNLPAPSKENRTHQPFGKAEGLTLISGGTNVHSPGHSPVRAAVNRSVSTATGARLLELFSPLSRDDVAPEECRVRLMALCTDRLPSNWDEEAQEGSVLAGCSGIIVAVGTEVRHLRVGDAVCGFVPLPSMRKVYTFSNTYSHLLQPIPPAFSFEAAAAIPPQLAHILHEINKRSQHSCETSSAASGEHGPQNEAIIEARGSRGSKRQSVLMRSQNTAAISEVTTEARPGTKLDRKAACDKSGIGKRKTSQYSCNKRATDGLHVMTPACLGEECDLQLANKRTFQETGSIKEETHGCTGANKHDDRLSCVWLIDADKKSRGDSILAAIHSPSTAIVIVDGSGAGLTAAVYFRDKGYYVMGLPFSKKQRRALETLDIRVVVAEMPGAVLLAEDVTIAARATPEKKPNMRAFVAAFNADLTNSGQHTAAVPCRAEQSAPYATLSAAVMEDATGAEALLELQGYMAETAAEPRTSSGPAALPVSPQICKMATADHSHEKGSTSAQLLSEAAAPATNVQAWPKCGRAFYGTLRSLEKLEHLLPWLAPRGIIYDFASEISPDEIKDRLYDQGSAVEFCRCCMCDLSTEDALSTVMTFGNALRDACDVLGKDYFRFSGLELHVFLDIATDKRAAFQEACNFASIGTHAGSVVCTYINPILHVPSPLTSSPATFHTHLPSGPAFITRREGCALAEEDTPEQLSAVRKINFLYTGVTDTEKEKARNRPPFEAVAERAERALQAFHVGESAFEEVKLPSVEERRKASFVVSGDLGGVSAAVARWLVQEGALYVALLHSENDEQKNLEEDPNWNWLTKTRTAARVITLPCSLQSEEDVRNTLRRLHEEFLLPPLRGLFHAPCDVSLDSASTVPGAIDEDRFVLEQKALAAWNLHHALGELHMEDSLQLFVLFSGISGLFGSIRRGAACAANTMLDMLACYRSRRGLSGLSIQWASWLAGGETAALSKRRGATLPCEFEPVFESWLSKGGITGVPDGLQALREILTLHISGRLEALVACFGADPVFAEAVSTGESGWIPKSTAFFEEQRLQALSADTRRCPCDVKVGNTGIGTGDCSKFEDILYELVYKEVCSLVCLHVILEKGQKLRADDTLSSLGMDSLTAAEVRYELQSRFRVEFDNQIVGQDATAETIASYIFSGLCLQLETNLSQELSTIKSSDNGDSVAIVSMALRLPGGCSCPGTLWGMLLAGTNCSREVYAFDDLTNHNFSLPHEEEKLPSRREVSRACYLYGADKVDSAVFGFNPAGTVVIDRQSLLLLEVAYEALFNINVRDPLSQSAMPIAVYAAGSACCEPPVSAESGASFWTHQSLQSPTFVGTCQQKSTSFATLEHSPSSSRSRETLPGLISYMLSLSGVSVPVNVGVGSSLAALCLAADHLRANADTEAALVGGVRVLPLQFLTPCASHGVLQEVKTSTCISERSWSPTPPITPVKKQHIRGEGAISVVLQNMRIARLNANSVLATIRGTSIKHVGRRDKVNLGEVGSHTAAAQSVLENALYRAGAKRSEVAVMEVAGVDFSSSTHHSECEAIAKVYGKERSDTAEFPIVIGSIDGNVGCLGEAAGLASLLKVVLMLARNRSPNSNGCVLVPPSLCLQHICRSTRLAISNCGGILFPSKGFFRRHCPPAAVSARGRAVSVSTLLHCPAENSHAATETPISGAQENRKPIEGSAAALFAGNLWHPHKVDIFSTKDSLTSWLEPPSSSLTSELCACSYDRSDAPNSPCGQSATERGSSVSNNAKRGGGSALGGVIASAHTGMVVHVLVEGAAATGEASVSSRDTQLKRGRADNKQQRLYSVCPQARARHSLPTVEPASEASATTDRSTVPATFGCPSAFGTRAVSLPAAASTCLTAVGRGSRCLWLFSNDYAQVLYCGRPLYFTSLAFAKELDSCSERMRRHLPSHLRELLYPTCEKDLLASKEILRQPKVANLSLFALQWCLGTFLRETAQGRVIAVAGIGVGEVAAAALAGLLSLDEAVDLVVYLSKNLHPRADLADVQVAHEKALSHEFGARRFSLPSTLSTCHRANSLDCEFTTDGDQTNQSSCFSVRDGTDASCRSLFENNETYPPISAVRRPDQQLPASFEAVSLCLDHTGNKVEQPSIQPRHLRAVIDHTLGLSALQKEKRFPGEREDAAEMLTYRTAANGPLQHTAEKNISTAGNSEALSRSPAPQAPAAISATLEDASKVLHYNHRRPKRSPPLEESTRPTSDVGISPPILVEHATGGLKVEAISRRVETKVSTTLLCKGDSAPGRQEGPCFFATRKDIDLPRCVAATDDPQPVPTSSLPLYRYKSPVRVNMCDTFRRMRLASFPRASSISPSTNILGGILQKRNSSQGAAQSVDFSEREARVHYGGRRSTLNEIGITSFPQAPVSALKSRRASSQCFPSQATSFGQLVGISVAAGSGVKTTERKTSCFERQSDEPTTEDRVPLGKTLAKASSCVTLLNNRRSTAALGRAAPADRQLESGTETFVSRSDQLPPGLKRDGVFDSPLENKEGQTRLLLVSENGKERFEKETLRCLDCANIRNVVNKISVARATCIFLSAVLGTAASDDLLRDPLYWHSTSQRKLHLRTTVKLARRVLRTAAIVVLGPPAAGPFHPAALLKLANHVEIFCFTGRSESLETVIPCESASTIRRAATVCTDIALRVSYAAPCWISTNAELSPSIRFWSRLVGVGPCENQLNRRRGLVKKRTRFIRRRTVHSD